MGSRRPLDTSTTYEIYFDQSKGYTPSKTSITKIHIHPSFDINSLANDVAIVEYNFTDQGNWVNYIAVYSEEWITTLYVSRVLSDASKQSWSLPYFKELNINALNCSAVSPLFANNPMDMRCHDLQKNGPWAKDCPLPYGAIYGQLLHWGKRSLLLHLLMHYIEWGESIIGRQISQLVEDTNGFAGVAQSPSYSMAGANPFNPAGKYLFTSDIRTPKLWNPNAAISNSAAPNSSSTASQPQTTSPSNSSIGSDNNGSIGSSSTNSGTGNNNSSSGNNDDGGDDSDNEESIVGIISNSVNFINPLTIHPYSRIRPIIPTLTFWKAQLTAKLCPLV
ncbi:hypothetical protein BX070DRAFT_257137 [Coemansia spiralis]|nr:hypothetical protein BX070DRAFT_257137 [Coemansia spiralis]